MRSITVNVLISLARVMLFRVIIAALTIACSGESLNLSCESNAFQGVIPLRKGWRKYYVLISLARVMLFRDLNAMARVVEAIKS